MMQAGGGHGMAGKAEGGERGRGRGDEDGPAQGVGGGAPEDVLLSEGCVARLRRCRLWTQRTQRVDGCLACLRLVC